MAVTANCDICESPWRAEIERKDAAWKADRTVQWARKKGIAISRFTLARHRANHMDNGNKPDVTEIPSSTARRPKIADPSNSTDASEASKMAGRLYAPARPITDSGFLNTVRDMVYERLVDGKIDLKIDSAFKAIEIKHRITEQSETEKLLLEILEEIRTEELKRQEAAAETGG